jgi:hypothetical protein
MNPFADLPEDEEIVFPKIPFPNNKEDLIELKQANKYIEVFLWKTMKYHRDIQNIIKQYERGVPSTYNESISFKENPIQNVNPAQTRMCK